MYNLDEYLIPLWEGNIVYDESIMVVRNRNGSISLQPLAYKATKIISVKNAALTVTYVEGTDYLLQDGMLKIQDNGNIFVMDYDDYFPINPKEGEAFSTYFGFTVWHEGAYFHDRQIVVTYEHKESDIYFPGIVKGDLVVFDKLRKKENLNMLFLGDSITFGWNSSALVDVAPYLPSWDKLTALSIQKRYGYEKVIEEDQDFSGIGNIRYVNTAVSGTSITWGLQNVQELVCNYRPDMVFLAFGMNAGGLDAATFKERLYKIIYEIRKDNSDCSVVLVATTYPNPNLTRKTFYIQEYVHVLHQVKEELGNIAVSDMSTLHKKLLDVKPYHHMTGNNINHPNDFLMRQYAIVTLHALKQ